MNTEYINKILLDNSEGALRIVARLFTSINFYQFFDTLHIIPREIQSPLADNSQNKKDNSADNS